MRRTWVERAVQAAYLSLEDADARFPPYRSDSVHRDGSRTVTANHTSVTSSPVRLSRTLDLWSRQRS